MFKKLHINVDHCATLRQARGTRYPDPVWAAALAETAGADGITVHLREDRRHISDRDVELLRQTVRSVLNLEMAATKEMLKIAKRVRPNMVTLVPERREERTTEGGLSLDTSGLPSTIDQLRSDGISVSLFVEPDTRVMSKANELGADTIELHTGEYCLTEGAGRDVQLQRLAQAAAAASHIGLKVAAGHGLDYPNVRPVAAIAEIEEFNIGHAIISRSIFVGLETAVRDMATLIGSRA